MSFSFCGSGFHLERTKGSQGRGRTPHYLEDMLRASPSGQSDCGLIIAILRSQIYKLSGIPLASQEQRMTQEVHAPSGLHTVLTGPPGWFAKGGNKCSQTIHLADIFVTLFLHASTRGRGLCHAPSHLQVPIDARPPNRPEWQTRNKPPHVRQCGCILGHAPAPSTDGTEPCPRENSDSFLSVQKRPQPRPRGSAFSKTTVWEPESYWWTLLKKNFRNRNFNMMKLKEELVQFLKSDSGVCEVTVWTAFRFCLLTLRPWQGLRLLFASTSLPVLVKIKPTNICQCSGRRWANS